MWTSYPNVTEPEAASPIQVGPGERREGIDLVLEKRQTYCVDAVVPPGEGVSLVLQALSGPRQRIVSAGRFNAGDEVEVCGVPPGQYRLTASTWGGQGFIAYGAVDLVVGERHASAVLAPAELPATAVAGLVRTRPVDQNGQFEFPGVPPGEYRLLALTGLLTGEGENPNFLRGHLAKAEELTVRPREVKSTKLELLSVRR